MADDTSTGLLDQLAALIEEERAALLSGTLEKLADILARKEALIEALKRAEPQDRSELEALQARVTRNQELFDQALHGIRNVSNRLGALRRLRRTLETYDELGRKTAIADPAASRLERRA